MKRTSKLLSILLALAMMLSLTAITALAEDPDPTAWYESDPSADVFYIGTADELAYVATRVNGSVTNFAGKEIILTNDIDLSGYPNWTPIGTNVSTRTYAGVFNGNHKIIDNLTLNIDVNAASNIFSSKGLFGSLGGSAGNVAIVKNLGLTNINIFTNISTSSLSTTDACFYGGVVGDLQRYSEVSGCFVTGEMSAIAERSSNTFQGHGGIAGNARRDTKISYCYSDVKIDFSQLNAGPTYVGGLVGISGTTGIIDNCYAAGSIIGVGLNSLGGIAGDSGIISNSVSLIPSIDATGTAARITVNGGSITNCYAWLGMKINGFPVDSADSNVQDGASLSAAEIEKAATWEGIFAAPVSPSEYGWEFEDGKLPVLKGFAPGAQTGGIPPHVTPLNEGAYTPKPEELWYFGENVDRANGPFYITTAEELASLNDIIAIDSFEGKTVFLDADLDLSGYSAGEGWLPIGGKQWQVVAFAGTFDGQGHIISNLFINRPAKSAGLFAYPARGTIKNLGVVDADVTGYIISGIIGAYGGSYENCFTTGRVRTLAVDTNSSFIGAGGIVGATTASIINCYSTATAEGPGRAGGIAGAAGLATSNTSNYLNLYSTGAMSGGNRSVGRAGGIIGAILDYDQVLKNAVALNPSLSNDASRIAGTDYNNKTIDNTFAWDGMLVGGSKISNAFKDWVYSRDREDIHGADISANDIYDGIVWDADHADFPDDAWIIEAGKLPILRLFDPAVQPSEIPAHIAAEVSRITGLAVPADAEIDGFDITAEVAANITYLPVDVSLFGGASWALFSDAECENEIEGGVMALIEGENTAYIKVTSANGAYSTVYTLTVTKAPAVLIGVTADAFVTKLSGNQNELTITVTEEYSDDSTIVYTETFSIDNNAADTFAVGDYQVYVDTKGNDQIREIYIVE